MSALLSPQKAQDRIGIGRTKLLALGRAGRIKTKELDGRYYFVAASLDKFAESLPDAFKATAPRTRARRH
jgi:hypothetical protein